MNNSNIQLKLEKLMKQQGFNMKSLSIEAGLNETSVRDIIKGRVVSPTHNTLDKLSKILKCNIDDLFKIDDETNDLSKVNSIDEDIFVKSIIQVDNIIDKNKINISKFKKAEIYLRWYQLNMLNRNEISSKSSDNTLVKLLKSI